MPKTLRRVLSVLFAVAVTSVCLYGAVSIVGAAGRGGLVTASANPATTSAATSAATPPPITRIQAPAVAPSPTTTEAHVETACYTCPVTGCSASTCPGATERAPPPAARARLTDTADAAGKI